MKDLEEKEFNKTFLGFTAFIRAYEIEDIAKYHGWDDIDYTQIKPIFDDLAKLTVGLIDYADVDSCLDIDTEEDSTEIKNYNYYKPCAVDFEGCDLCFFKNFRFINRYHAYDDMDTFLVDSISMHQFLDKLRDKYDARLITLIRGFAFIEFTMAKENADKIEKWEQNKEDENDDGDFYECAINSYMEDYDLEEASYGEFYDSLLNPKIVTFEMIKEKYSNINVDFNALKDMIMKDENFHTMTISDSDGNNVNFDNPNFEQIHGYYDNEDDDYAEVIFRKDGTAHIVETNEVFIWNQRLYENK